MDDLERQADALLGPDYDPTKEPGQDRDDDLGRALYGLGSFKRQTNILAEEHRKAAGREEGTLEQVSRRAIPVVSTVLGIGEDEAYKDARSRTERGTGSRADARIVAEYEQRKQAEADAPFETKLSNALLGIGALAGESAMSAGLLPAGTVGATGLRKAAEYGGRLLGSTALTPSFYLPGASQRSVQQGGEVYSPQNLAPEFLKGVALNAALGVAGQAGASIANPVARLGTRVATQIGADEAGQVALGALDKVLPDLWQTRTKFGTIGELVDGKYGEAIQGSIIKFATFATFNVLHGNPRHVKEVVEKTKEKIQETIEKGQANGLNPDVIAEQIAKTVEKAQEDQPPPEAPPQAPEPSPADPTAPAGPEATPQAPTAPAASGGTPDQQRQRKALETITSSSNLADWVKDTVTQTTEHAIRTGLASKVEALAAQGKIARQIAKELGIDEEDARSIRTGLGIPSRNVGEDARDFDVWLKGYQSTKAVPQQSTPPGPSPERIATLRGILQSVSGANTAKWSDAKVMAEAQRLGIADREFSEKPVATVIRPEPPPATDSSGNVFEAALAGQNEQYQRLYDSFAGGKRFANAGSPEAYDRAKPLIDQGIIQNGQDLFAFMMEGYDARKAGLTGRPEPPPESAPAVVEPPTAPQTPAANAADARPAPKNLESAIMTISAELGRELNTKLVPIHEVRARIRKLYGDEAASRNVFDEAVLAIRRSKQSHLISISDRSRATSDQLRDSVPGVGETFFYMENPAEPPAPPAASSTLAERIKEQVRQKQAGIQTSEQTRPTGRGPDATPDVVDDAEPDPELTPAVRKATVTATGEIDPNAPAPQTALEAWKSSYSLDPPPLDAMVEAGLNANEQAALGARWKSLADPDAAKSFGDVVIQNPATGAPYTRQRIKQFEQEALKKLDIEGSVETFVNSQKKLASGLANIEGGGQVQPGELAHDPNEVQKVYNERLTARERELKKLADDILKEADRARKSGVRPARVEEVGNPDPEAPGSTAQGPEPEGVGSEALPTGSPKLTPNQRKQAKLVRESGEAGIDPAELHGLAAELLSQARALEAADPARDIVPRALSALEEFGVTRQKVDAVRRAGGDAGSIPGLDDVAQQLRGDYPQLFDNDRQTPSDVLYELLTTKVAKPMTETEAYQKALATLTDREYERARDAASQSGIAPATVEAVVQAGEAAADAESEVSAAPKVGDRYKEWVVTRIEPARVSYTNVDVARKVTRQIPAKEAVVYFDSTKPEGIGGGEMTASEWSSFIRGEFDLEGSAAGDLPAGDLPAGADVVGFDPAEFGQPLTEAERRTGMIGGAQPGASESTRPLRVTALANEQIDKERIANRLPPLMAEARRTNPAVWDAAMAKLDADPLVADRLVAELTQNRRATTVDENALLLQRRIALANEHERVMREFIAGFKTKADAITMNALEARADRLLQEIDLNDRVARETGSEWGRAGQFRRQLAAEDYSLDKMLLSAQAAKGQPLTREEQVKIGELQEKITAADDRLAQAESGEKPAAKAGMIGDLSDLRIATKKPRREFLEAVAGMKRGSQSWPRRALGQAADVANSARSLITSMDLSAVFRQGGMATFAHPIRAARAFPEMLRAFASEHAADRAADALDQRPNAVRYKQAGLYLANREGPLSGREEAYVSRLAGKIPLVKGSERAYTTFLNRMRADVFDAMTASLAKGGMLTDAEAKVIANFVNVSTGRGGLGSLERAAVPLSTLFFSPRFLASRMQLMVGQPLFDGSGRTRSAVAQEYGRALIGLGVFYGLMKALAPDSTIELDPRSSDFGKVKIGNTRIDPLAGLSQLAVFMTRLVSGETKSTNTGKVSPLRGKDVKYGGQTVSDVIDHFIRSKLAPAPGAIVDVVAGENVVGEKTTKTNVAANLTIPIAIRDVWDTLSDQGVPKGAIAGLLAILGMGTQVYEPRAKKKAG